MRIPARRLARTSKRGKALHIIEWRRTDPDQVLSLCNDGLMLMPEDPDKTPFLPICKMCLKAEEALRAVITFSDIKVNRLELRGLTIAQAIVAAMQHSVPHHAVLAVEGGCSYCPDSTVVLEWYTSVDGQP